MLLYGLAEQLNSVTEWGANLFTYHGAVQHLPRDEFFCDNAAAMNEEKPPIALDEIVKIYKPEAESTNPEPDSQDAQPVEIGGPKGPEPTRYGDWEKKGRCIDF